MWCLGVASCGYLATESILHSAGQGGGVVRQPEHPIHLLSIIRQKVGKDSFESYGQVTSCWVLKQQRLYATMT